MNVIAVAVKTWFLAFSIWTIRKTYWYAILMNPIHYSISCVYWIIEDQRRQEHGCVRLKALYAARNIVHKLQGSARSKKHSTNALPLTALAAPAVDVTYPLATVHPVRPAYSHCRNEVVPAVWIGGLLQARNRACSTCNQEHSATEWKQTYSTRQYNWHRQFDEWYYGGIEWPRLRRMYERWRVYFDCWNVGNE